MNFQFALIDSIQSKSQKEKHELTHNVRTCASHQRMIDKKKKKKIARRETKKRNPFKIDNEGEWQRYSSFRSADKQCREESTYATTFVLICFDTFGSAVYRRTKISTVQLIAHFRGIRDHFNIYFAFPAQLLLPLLFFFYFNLF